MVAILASPIYSAYNDDSPTGDRIRTLLRNRRDLDDSIKALSSGGRKGASARKSAAAAIDSAKTDLLGNSLEDIEAAIGIFDADVGEDAANLHFLKALILLRMGRTDEAAQSARDAIEADPEHNGARDILHRRTS
jgi:tetratricopeptide (TPR) repeat protein